MKRFNMPVKLDEINKKLDELNTKNHFDMGDLADLWKIVCDLFRLPLNGADNVDRQAAIKEIKSLLNNIDNLLSVMGVDLKSDEKAPKIIKQMLTLVQQKREAIIKINNVQDRPKVKLE